VGAAPSWNPEFVLIEPKSLLVLVPLFNSSDESLGHTTSGNLLLNAVKFPNTPELASKNSSLAQLFEL
jgi:hypothetical protein